MKALGEAIKTLISKFAGVFHLIDVSFLFSGGVALIALWWLFVGGAGFTLKELGEDGVVVPTLMALFGAYVLGLLCFAIGRAARRAALGRRTWRRSGSTPGFENSLDETARAHGLERDPRFRGYWGGQPAAGPPGWRLYVRLWAEARHDKELEASLVLLNHYWKLAAIYDGLVVALMLWAVALTVQPPIGSGYGNLVLTVLVVLAGLFCGWEASRFDRNQLEELAATLAVGTTWPGPGGAPAPLDRDRESL